MKTSDREIKRVMYEIKTRTLTIKKVELLTPALKRITLTGEELDGFTSQSPDAHIKVFFPYPGEENPVVPILGPGGPQTPPGSRPPIMRDYTPRRYDASARELDIEFVLHGDGAASQWAEQARVGQKLTIGGPRGSRVVPYAFDWYLLIGDETSLPSIARRLEELPKDARAIVVIEIEDQAHEIPLKSEGNARIHWVHRNGKPTGDETPLKAALSRIEFPKGDYFAWVSAEKSCAMKIRDFLLQSKGASEDWIKATGYWTR